MTNILTEEFAADFFEVHDSIVFGILKRCSLSYNDRDYDDFIQIGRLALLKAYETFPQEVMTDEQFYQFTGFAYRKVYWTILDHLRKEAKRKNEACSLPEETEGLKEFSCEGFELDWIETYSLNEFIQCLPENERRYIEERVLNGLSITAIAEKYQTSRKTVYTWRDKVKARLQTQALIENKGGIN
ncbi:MAG: sigma-70 family RNA polymerase sigma factor [Alkalibacterium sp.]|nr:sigma-70 family RNA polymerase sigma factor [Alkalibacterium sp.]TVP93486.1 MAG: sigma-70 family RNA polymerase sigma factor [Alkalibacterium sp.]